VKRSFVNRFHLLPKPVLSLLIFLLGGCNASSPSVLTFPDCSGVNQLTVSTGPAPSFRWTPTCHIGSLSVTEVQTGVTQWHFYGPFRSNPQDIEGILPVIVYGVLPPHATELVHAVDLVSGASYRVTIFAMAGQGEDPVPLKSTVFQF
jgi:hypothetical protein